MSDVARLTHESLDEIRRRNDGASGAVSRLLEHIDSLEREMARLQREVVQLPIGLVDGFIVPRKGASLPATAASLVAGLLEAAVAEREERSRRQPGSLTIYLAGRGAETAHLAPHCRHLADRPDWCSSPTVRTARPVPGREGWVEYEVHDGTRRLAPRQVKLCLDCVARC